MFGFFIMLAVLSSIFGTSRSTERLLTGIFTFFAVMYGLRFLLAVGFQFLPLILLIWLAAKVVIPFVKGFVSSFQKQ